MFALFQQGKNLKTDTLSHFISVQNIRLAISSLENQIQITSLQLKQLMGIEQTVDVAFSDTVFVDDEMMRGLLNDVMVGLGWDFVSRTGKESSSFGSNPAKNPPNQHDQDVADDPLTTLDYHCLDVSRDDEMAEQAFEWCCGCHWVAFWLR